MNVNPFWHFLSLQLFKERSKHLPIVLISVLILFLLASVLFLSSSIRYSLEQNLAAQPDFTVTKVQGGLPIATPQAWADEILDLYGVNKVSSRVYGRYFFEPKGQSFLIVGIDFLEEQSHKQLHEVMDKIDLQAFFKTSQMLVGDGVKAYLKTHFYEESYQFITPKGEFVKVGIFDTLPHESNLIANDMMVMPIDLARKILGVKTEEVTDIIFNVPNEDEWDMMSDKLSALHYDLHVVTKENVRSSYENLYNYQGGIFLILYLIVLITFGLILYARYSTIYLYERRQIGLLRALGWNINTVLKFKFAETFIVVMGSFIVGTTLAYIYVFMWGAPLLKEIFLGGQNLSNQVTFVPTVDFSVLTSIFLLYCVPFIAAVLIPVWKISITDPKEAML